VSVGDSQGSFVYLLLCRDGGPLYFKLGVTDLPTRRLGQIKRHAPATPLRFCFFEMPTRLRALTVAHALRLVLRPWQRRGGAFAVELAEKPVFNAALRLALEPHRTERWPCTWHCLSIAALERRASEQQRDYVEFYKHGA
jgi:hypothetical protein